MDKVSNYYTYIYFDPSNNYQPFYVGKGKNDRAWDHLRLDKRNYFINKLKGMISKGIQPIIGIYGGLDEEFAFFLEKELISHYGRRDIGTGCLCNMTDGGEGFSGGRHTEESKRKIAESNRNLDYVSIGKKVSIALTGKKLSPEHIEKIAAKKRGTAPWNKGKTMDDEFSKKVSEAQKGRVQSEEVKKKLSESMKASIAARKAAGNYINKALSNGIN